MYNINYIELEIDNTTLPYTGQSTSEYCNICISFKKR